MFGGMSITVVDSELTGADALLSAVVKGCESVEAVLSSLRDDEVVDLVTELELQARRTGALQLAVMDQVHDRGLFRADGHASAKDMVRHVGALSPGEAAGREKARRALQTLPAVRGAYCKGSIGTDQVRLLGRVHANRRVAPHMAERDDTFVRQARQRPYLEFELAVRHWERLADRDGSETAAERAHENRNFSLTQDELGLGWEMRGRCGPMSGAAMDEIFQPYLNAEWEADWEKARAEHGDDATVDHLPRTDAQRRADAAWRIFQDAASAPPDSSAPRFVHNIVWDAETYEQMVAELDGDERRPLDPDSYRCSTIDGVPLAPTEAVMNSLLAEIRRVVVDAAGTVIDLGTARRFTGSARLAAQLQSSTCVWRGCSVRASECEIDHIRAHSDGGRTNPGNGAPLCGRHNRWKQKGFTTWRDPSGGWHTYRPDGTEIS